MKLVLQAKIDVFDKRSQDSTVDVRLIYRSAV